MIKFEHSYENLHGVTEFNTSLTLYADSDLEDVMQFFKQFLLSVGFHQKSIDKYMVGEE